jgi:hypothetical protein
MDSRGIAVLFPGLGSHFLFIRPDRLWGSSRLMDSNSEFRALFAEDKNGGSIPPFLPMTF